MNKHGSMNPRLLNRAKSDPWRFGYSRNEATGESPWLFTYFSKYGITWFTSLSPSAEGGQPAGFPPAQNTSIAIEDSQTKTFASAPTSLPMKT